MIHKGVEFTVTAVAPGIWKWQFRVGDRVIAGKTEARLNLLAIRRVQLRIDRELKKAGNSPSAGSLLAARWGSQAITASYDCMMRSRICPATGMGP